MKRIHLMIGAIIALVGHVPVLVQGHFDHDCPLPRIAIMHLSGLMLESW